MRVGIEDGDALDGLLVRRSNAKCSAWLKTVSAVNRAAVLARALSCYAARTDPTDEGSTI